MKNGLDIVAVGVEQKRCVVTRMVIAFARRAIVSAAILKTDLVKGSTVARSAA